MRGRWHARNAESEFERPYAAMICVKQTLPHDGVRMCVFVIRV